MALITVFYSATEQDILAVVGEAPVAGVRGVSVDGCKELGKFVDLDTAVDGVQYLKADIEKLGDLLFLMYGGTISEAGAEDVAQMGYEQIAQFEVDDVA